jgi:hypothetical protein
MIQTNNAGVRTIHKQLTREDSRSYLVIRLPRLRLIPEDGMIWRADTASFIGCRMVWSLLASLASSSQLSQL